MATQKFMGSNQLINRLASQVGSKETAIAILQKRGHLKEDGKTFTEEGLKRNSMTARVIQTQENEIYDFLLASPQDSLDGKPIVLTQKDIRELQLAKAAIASGIKILLKTTGAGIEDIDDIYLAGALGNYVHPFSAMRIGLLPKVNPEKITSLGNAASTGANMILLSKRYWERSAEIAADLEYLELSGHADFFDSFIEEMNFPTENLW